MNTRSRRDRAQPLGMRARMRARVGVGLEVELHGEPHEAQHPQRVLRERTRSRLAQPPAREVLLTAQRVDRLARLARPALLVAGRSR